MTINLISTKQHLFVKKDMQAYGEKIKSSFCIKNTLQNFLVHKLGTNRSICVCSTTKNCNKMCVSQVQSCSSNRYLRFFDPGLPRQREPVFFLKLHENVKKIGPRGEHASLEMHKVGNVGIKDLCRGLAKFNSEKYYFQWEQNQGPTPLRSDPLLSETTWQVLVEGYLTSLLLVHQLTSGLAKFNTA